MSVQLNKSKESKGINNQLGDKDKEKRKESNMFCFILKLFKHCNQYII